VKIRFGAYLLLASLLLPACSGGENPNVLPPIATATSAAPAPTPLAVPPEARAESSEGASAFVRFYLGEMNRGFATGDASDVRILSSADCAGCTNLIQLIEAGEEGAERFEGGDYAVTSVASPETVNGEVTALVTYDLTAVRVTDDQGQVLRETPRKERLSATISMSRSAGSWSVVEFESVAA